MTSTPMRSAGTMPASIHGLTIDDLRREFGDRWEIAAIPQGYRAVLRETGERAPVVLYGRTPAELAESIRMAQVSPWDVFTGQASVPRGMNVAPLVVR